MQLGSRRPLVYDRHGFPLTNNAEGGTNGVTASNANTGGASGVAFDTTAGTAAVFSNAHPAHGSLSYLFTAAAVPASTFISWTTAIGGTRKFSWSRHYVYVTALPATTNYALIFLFDLSGTGTAAGLAINDTGTIGVVTASSSLASTNTITTGSMFRVETKIVCDPTVGSFEMKLFLNRDASVPDEVVTRTNQNTQAGFNALRTGYDGATLQNGYQMWIDDIGISDRGYMGPV